VGPQESAGGQVAPRISEAREWKRRGLGVKGREVRGDEVAKWREDRSRPSEEDTW
jgi:hypothetical protein